MPDLIVLLARDSLEKEVSERVRGREAAEAASHEEPRPLQLHSILAAQSLVAQLQVDLITQRLVGEAFLHYVVTEDLLRPAR